MSKGGPFRGSAATQILVILYAKHLSPADQIALDDIFAVEDDVFPFDGTDMLEQRYVDPLAFGITFV
jgi:hypothetical protein